MYEWEVELTISAKRIHSPMFMTKFYLNFACHVSPTFTDSYSYTHSATIIACAHMCTHICIRAQVMCIHICTHVHKSCVRTYICTHVYNTYTHRSKITSKLLPLCHCGSSKQQRDSDSRGALLTASHKCVQDGHR